MGDPIFWIDFSNEEINSYKSQGCNLFFEHYKLKPIDDDDDNDMLIIFKVHKKKKTLNMEVT